MTTPPDDDRRVVDVPPADRPNLARPRYNQRTYVGRARHFFETTNPMNLLATSAQLEEAKRIVENYNKDKFDERLRVRDVWRAKQLFDSAYHPDTHELMVMPGRMSAQVPANMLITGLMMTFYQRTSHVVFLQWLNQTFNACVNYTNRSGDNPIPKEQLLTSYCAATGGALATALGLNAAVKRAPPLVGRFVPICAVAAANSINIPMMRKRELDEGIGVTTEAGEKLGESRVAARAAITQVVLSRCAMALPGMTVTPFIMEALNRKQWWRARAHYLAGPFQTVFIGVILTFATPLCCALFPQISCIDVDKLEPELQAKIRTAHPTLTEVCYNKGL